MDFRAGPFDEALSEQQKAGEGSRQGSSDPLPVALANAEAVKPVEGVRPHAVRIAGARSGLGAGDVPHRQISEFDLLDILDGQGHWIASRQRISTTRSDRPRRLPTFELKPHREVFLGSDRCFRSPHPSLDARVHAR